MEIFYDVDTQKDFMNKDGALYVPDAELIKPALARLAEQTRVKRILVVGSFDQHFGTEEYKERETELQRWGGSFPDHCMNGTSGQEKIAETLAPTLPERLFDIYIPHSLNGVVPNAFLTPFVRSLKEKGPAGGIYFEKQTYDAFANPALPVFLEEAGVTRAVVYGVATDYCVKAAALGMRRLGIEVRIVEDAIKGVAPETTEAALAEMRKAGCRFVSLEQVLQGG